MIKNYNSGLAFWHLQYRAVILTWKLYSVPALHTKLLHQGHSDVYTPAS